MLKITSLLMEMNILNYIFPIIVNYFGYEEYTGDVCFCSDIQIYIDL